MIDSIIHIPQIIQLPKFLDPRGNLTFLESNKQAPFATERVYWIYDVPGGEVRGGHAFKSQNEFIIALSGSFDVVLNNGKEEMKYQLNRSYYGLYIPAMHWRSMENFSTNSVAMILVDSAYDIQEYIRDFNEFKSLLS